MTVVVALTKGHSTLVDDADWEFLRQFTWRAVMASPNALVYAVTTIPSPDRRQLRLHRMLLNPPPGILADHINGDTLDNRRCNLRLATAAQNAANCRRTKSKYVGVRRIGFRYYVHLMCQGALLSSSGGFDTAEDAARARDALALRHHGEFAVLNFPREDVGASSRGGPGA